jgi:TolB protein
MHEIRVATVPWAILLFCSPSPHRGESQVVGGARSDPRSFLPSCSSCPRRGGGTKKGLLRRLSAVALLIALGLGMAGHKVSVRAATPAASPKVLRLTRDGRFKQHLSWSPDGEQLLCTRLFQGKMGLWTIDTTTGELKPLLAQTTPHFDGHWSADGKKVVFVWDILQGTDGKLQINTVNADGTDNKVLIPHKAFEESPRWSPDSKRIAWVSTRHGNQEIYTVDASGKDEKRLTNEIAFDNNPCWSPDGKRIAFASSRTGNFEIHVMDTEGGHVKRLTDNPALDYWPAWSPDGKRIAFTSNRDGNYEIYLMNADGSGVRNLTRHPRQDNFAAWSPDGKKIAFVSNRDGGHDVYVVEVEKASR